VEFFALLGLLFLILLLVSPFVMFSLLGRVSKLEDSLKDLRREIDRRQFEAPRKSIFTPTPPMAEAAKPPAVAPPTPPPLPSDTSPTAVTPLFTVEEPELTEVRLDEDPEPTKWKVSEGLRQTSAAAVEWAAERWMAWVGAVALLFGLGFFLKYAIDRGWLGPEIRVAMGLGFSVVLYGLGFYLLRRDYRPVGQGVAGASLGFWHLSLYAAHHWYSLVAETTMFAGMALGAGAVLALAIVENAQPVAVLGLVGGFLAPYLMTTRTPSPWPLFGYILLLDTTALAGASFRKWRTADLFAFAATTLMWIAWLNGIYTRPYLVDVLLLLTIYFALFAAMSVWNQFVVDRGTEPGDLLLVFATPFAYGVAVHELTRAEFSRYHGLGAIGLAAVYALLTLLGRSLRPSQQLLRDCLAGISLSFVAVAIPLQFTGHWIPIVWAIYAAVLVTVGLRRGVVALRGGGFCLIAVVQILLATYIVETLAHPNAITPRWLQRPGWLDAPLFPDAWSWINGRSLAMLSNALALGWIAREYRRYRGAIEAWEHDAAGRSFFFAALAAAGTAILETYAFVVARKWPIDGFYGLSGVYLALLVGALVGLGLRVGPRWLFDAARATAAMLFAALVFGALVFAADRDRVASLANYPLWSIPILVNPRGAAFLTTAIVAGLAFMLSRRNQDLSATADAQDGWSPASQFAFLSLLTAWLTAATETFAAAPWLRWNDTETLAASIVHLSALTAGAGWLTLRVGPRNSVAIAMTAAVVSTALCLALGGRTFESSAWQREATGSAWSVSAVFNPRGLAFACAVASFTLFARLFRHSSRTGESGGVTVYGAAACLAHLTLWYAITVEVYALGAAQEWSSGKILGITLAWTIYGLGLFAVGLAWRWTSVRMASLVVFAATTAKVFLYDVWELSPVIRYFAFIGLGVALLSTSYFYRRFRDRLRTFIANP
jgi:hypothetical protein